MLLRAQAANRSYFMQQFRDENKNKVTQKTFMAGLAGSEEGWEAVGSQ